MRHASSHAGEKSPLETGCGERLTEGWDYGVIAGKEPALLSGQLARDALVLCHREIESVKTGKPVAVG